MTEAHRNLVQLKKNPNIWHGRYLEKPLYLSVDSKLTRAEIFAAVASISSIFVSSYLSLNSLANFLIKLDGIEPASRDEITKSYHTYDIIDIDFASACASPVMLDIAKLAFTQLTQIKLGDLFQELANSSQPRPLTWSLSSLSAFLVERDIATKEGYAALAAQSPELNLPEDPQNYFKDYWEGWVNLFSNQQGSLPVDTKAIESLAADLDPFLAVDSLSEFNQFKPFDLAGSISEADDQTARAAGVSGFNCPEEQKNPAACLIDIYGTLVRSGAIVQSPASLSSMFLSENIYLLADKTLPFRNSLSMIQIAFLERLIIPKNIETIAISRLNQDFYPLIEGDWSAVTFLLLKAADLQAQERKEKGITLPPQRTHDKKKDLNDKFAASYNWLHHFLLGWSLISFVFTIIVSISIADVIPFTSIELRDEISEALLHAFILLNLAASTVALARLVTVRKSAKNLITHLYLNQDRSTSQQTEITR